MEHARIRTLSSILLWGAPLAVVANAEVLRLEANEDTEQFKWCSAAADA